MDRSVKMDEKILVSVVCLTYNHEEYIRDALDGILIQETDFRYEVVVHDDASTDNTQQIIRKYEEQYPDLFRCIYQQQNQFSIRGAQSLFGDVSSICRGKYIAICEGDDFWIDRHKLQIQIQWMEEHPEYFMTAHNALLIDCTDYSLKAISPYTSDKELSPEEVIMQYKANLPTASLVMKSDIRNMEDFFLESGVGDIPAQFYSIFYGKIYYFDRIMSVYRYYHKGSWCKEVWGNTRSVVIHYIKMIRFTEKYDNYTEEKYDEWVRQLKYKYLYTIMKKCEALADDEYKKIVKTLDTEIDSSLYEYWSRVRGILEIIRNESYLSEEIISFVTQKTNVYIWGTGYYAGLLAEKILQRGWDFKGFLLSDGQPDIGSYKGKKVQKISELYVKKKTESGSIDKIWNDTNIVVAVNPVIWEEIRQTLSSLQIKNWIYMLEI